jgi:hypothetical protein
MYNYKPFNNDLKPNWSPLKFILFSNGLLYYSIGMTYIMSIVCVYFNIGNILGYILVSMPFLSCLSYFIAMLYDLLLYKKESRVYKILNYGDW